MEEFIAVELNSFGWGAAAAIAGRFAFVSEGGKERHFFVFKQHYIISQPTDRCDCGSCSSQYTANAMPPLGFWF